MWVPLTVCSMELVCPNCHLALKATRWEDGQPIYDQPQRLFCIQRYVILISRIYHCPNDHQTLAHGPGVLQIVSEVLHSPFVLFHKYGHLSQYILSNIHAGLKIADIECLLKQMHHDYICFKLMPLEIV